MLAFDLYKNVKLVWVVYEHQGCKSLFDIDNKVNISYQKNQPEPELFSSQIRRSLWDQATMIPRTLTTWNEMIMSLIQANCPNSSKSNGFFVAPNYSWLSPIVSLLFSKHNWQQGNCSEEQQQEQHGRPGREEAEKAKRKSFFIESKKNEKIPNFFPLPSE